MYSWLWQHLPGPFPVRLLLAAAAALAVVAVLFLWVFPWVQSVIEYDDAGVPESAAGLRGGR